ncbi:hypothetical protein [Bradyrhizobium diazoefficiens]
MTDAPHFHLLIHTRTGHFGETSMSERQAVADLLRRAAQEIASGAPAAPLKCSGGHVVGDYEFGPGMVNGDGKIDRTHMQTPPTHAGVHGSLER